LDGGITYKGSVCFLVKKQDQQEWRAFYNDMQTLIWGCGRLGRTAYQYYKENCDIVGFIDIDQSKWGTYLFSRKVYSPEILSTFIGIVVIAVSWDYENINTVVKKYNRNITTIIFKIEQLVTEKRESTNLSVDDKTVMLYFGGGLGNQMFQYALARNYLKQGKKVVANIASNINQGTESFSLCKVFNNIVLDFGGDEIKQKIIQQNSDLAAPFKNFRISVENMQLNIIKEADMSLLEITGGIIRGLHQNYLFAQKVEKELKDDFTFNIKDDFKLVMVSEMVTKMNCVSVHIRRGDYLTDSNRYYYGGICTEKYYDKAMKEIESKVGKCIFCFFSNDMNWVKDHFKMTNAIYIESNMFDNYQDWYDMYLMSQCKHNIIANSTFSWWGAWLNQNQGKIVIAPKKWINVYNYTDIYPSDWITI